MKIWYGIIFIQVVHVKFTFSAQVQGIVNNSATLECPISKSGSYEWRKGVDPDGSEFGNVITDTEKYYGSSTRTLIIKNLVLFDSGKYRCKHGMETGNVDLVVAVLVQGVVSRSATMNCPATTSITSTYTWQMFRENFWQNAITDSAKYDGARTQSLTITNLYSSDSGLYRCSASGLQGYVKLTVEDCFNDNSCTPWTDWNICDRTCGGGLQYRTRQCSGSGFCNDTFLDNQICNQDQCPVDGVWGHWGAWSACSLTCGDGIRLKSRECNNPPPSNGGAHCQGSNKTSVSCLIVPCPEDGNWGQWSAWSTCPVSCGGGVHFRSRECTNPPPSNGGAQCKGTNETSDPCATEPCPVDGVWGQWNSWSICPVTCGGGNITRSRECNNPPPSYGGADCPKRGKESQVCSSKICPERSEASASVAPVAVGVSATVVIVVVVIIALCIIKKRRNQENKQENMTENKNSKYCNETDVRFRTDHDHGETYINLSRPSRTSSSDTDDLRTVSSQIPTENSNMMKEYYNVSIKSTNVRVEDLKNHIEKNSADGLKEQYKKVPYGSQHPTTKAQHKDNIPKNRFKTTFPYDHTRVILETFPGVENSDYINANFVDGFEAEKGYIASQGPTKFTLQDHWRMIWQQNIRKIVMLTNLIEGGKVKCERYWPRGEKPLMLGNIVLTLLSEKERAAYITREISVKNRKTKEKRNVIQYHFTAWPDHGTPDPLYLVLFYKHVMSDHSKMETGPLLVHCSAGIGRTGTFIALDALCKEGRTTGFVNIVEFLTKMRYCRMNMIQTAEQYVCLHYALLEVFTMKDTIIRKDHFTEVWREIQSDKKRPINQQRLNEEFKMLEEKKAEHEKAEYVAALSTENIDKNRSRNSLPMDSKRLYLVSFEKGRSDFINAVHAPSYTKFIGYLTTQLPLPDTKVDFWTMIRDHRSSVIVLILNGAEEIDLVYTSSSDSFTCGPFNLRITKKETRDCDITESTIVMSKKDDKPKEVYLYQAICKDMPEPTVLCRLVDLISTRISMSQNPVTVVSRDGAKNCGLFCAFTNAVFSMKIDEKVDIFQLVRLLQLRRPNFLSDFEEYRLCYEALDVYLESTNVYANF